MQILLRQYEPGTAEYEKAIRLRYEVLRKPLGFEFQNAYSEEQLVAEVGDIHLGLWQDDEILSTCILTRLGSAMKIRQVATRADCRGQGLGARLMRYAQGYAEAEDFTELELNAREPAAIFYLRLGYWICSEQFEEVGIPHYYMRKSIGRNPLAYVNQFPDDLEEAVGRGAWAVLPIGALEWHGAHLPFGVDHVLAAEFAKQLSRETKSILLPTFDWPITTLPHKFSLALPTGDFQSAIRAMLSELRRAGFAGVHLVTGHYAQGHEVELYNLADEFTTEEFKVLASSPLEVLADDSLLDHAGKWETGQYAIFEGESAMKLEMLPEKLVASRDAVLGDHPKNYDLLQTGLHLRKAILKWKEMSKCSAQELKDYYSKGREAYAGYSAKYFRESWEQAIQDWWNSQAKA